MNIEECNIVTPGESAQRIDAQGTQASQVRIDVVGEVLGSVPLGTQAVDAKLEKQGWYLGHRLVSIIFHYLNVQGKITLYQETRGNKQLYAVLRQPQVPAANPVLAAPALDQKGGFYLPPETKVPQPQPPVTKVKVPAIVLILVTNQPPVFVQGGMVEIQR